MFRGIDVTGRTIENLQDELRASPQAPITPEVIAMGRAIEKEYKAKKEAAIKEHNDCLMAAEDACRAKKKAERKRKLDERWPQMTAEEKAAVDGGSYFLREEFLNGKHEGKTIMVKVSKDSFSSPGTALLRTAMGMRLEYETLDLPKYHAERIGRLDTLVIISRSASALKANEKWRTITEDINTKRYVPSQEVLAATGKGKHWNVAGKYLASSPQLERGWGNDDDDLVMEIFTRETKKGPQMSAKFRYNLVKGVMRFARHPDSKKSNTETKESEDNKRKRKRENSEDEDKDDYGPGCYDRRSPTPEGFFLGTVTNPSRNHYTW